jgi:hypothetical protein
LGSCHLKATPPTPLLAPTRTAELGEGGELAVGVEAQHVAEPRLQVAPLALAHVGDEVGGRLTLILGQGLPADEPRDGPEEGAVGDG